MPIFNLQQSIIKTLHNYLFYFVLLGLSFFSITLNAQNSSKITMLEIYSDKQIKVEVEFKLYNSICKDLNKSNKYTYIVTGQLYSFNKEVKWNLKYIDCNGNPQDEKKNISIGGNEAEIGRIESIDQTFQGNLFSNNKSYIKEIIEKIEDLVRNNKFIEAKSELENNKSLINDAALINKKYLLIYDKAEKYYIKSLNTISALDKYGLKLANNLTKEAEELFPNLPNIIYLKKKELEIINLEQNRIEIQNEINQLIEQKNILEALIKYNVNNQLYNSQEIEKILIKDGETFGKYTKNFVNAKELYNQLFKLTGDKNYLDEINKCENKIKKQEAIKAKTIKKEERELFLKKDFSSIGITSGEIAKFGIIYEHGGVKKFGYRLAFRTSLTSELEIINGSATKNKTEFEIGTNYNIYKAFYLNFGVGYGYYKRLLNNDFSGSIFTENKGYFVTTTGIMYRLNNQFNVNCGLAFMDINEELYKPELTLGVTYNLKSIIKNQNKTYSTTSKNKSKNYYSSLPSFSSLGFQSGEIAKYGLLYETGGRRTVGFRISARTTLKPEQLFSKVTVEKRNEIELGPNFRISESNTYLNLGIGYGNYEFLSQYNKGYYIATTGIMYRISRVININVGTSFIDINKDFYDPEITFGISFNLNGKYKY